MQDLADPSRKTATWVVQKEFNLAPISVKRFATGAQHFVFDVVLPTGQNVVVRLSRPVDCLLGQGTLFWTKRLRDLGIHVPRVLCFDLSCQDIPYPYLVLERLPGCDLGDVYESLTNQQRGQIAERLAGYQAKVATLPDGTGFGFVADPNGTFPHKTWTEVLDSEVLRSTRRITADGLVNPNFVDRTRHVIRDHATNFAEHPATPFLHDITTRNVIVHDRKLQGIVDIDQMCFGDPMYLPALMNVALRAHGLNPAYVEQFLTAVKASPDQRWAVQHYSVVHCLGFLSELGTRFNNVAVDPVDPDYQIRLENLFDQLHTELASSDR